MQLRRRLMLLTARDPFEILELVRAALLIRWFVLRSCMRVVEEERARLRRIVVWLGELDALCSIARLRDERPDTSVPDLVDGPLELHAHALVHPLVERCVGNDIALARGMLVTGSNMSGKSTLLRAVALNAILAQSIHTTFGHWRAPLLAVRAVMRIRDDVDAGMSTYAVEVEAVGELVAAATERGPLPSLFVLDEPFHGTNPAIRVPIVVAVFEHLAARDLVIGATHDLDVAKLLGASFERAYFAELPCGGFDRTLHAGVAPSTNAVELLARAGYPPDLLARVERVRARA
jgi:DNA mismatch repair ATPase MutS